VVNSTVKAMTRPCAALSRAGGFSGFWGLEVAAWGQSVGGSWRLAARATAACSLMRGVTRGCGDASQQYVWRGCPVGNAASLVGDAVRRLSRQCGVRCEEQRLELRRWAGEIILKAIAVPGLFLQMCRLYCTATRAPLVYVEVVGLRRCLPQRVGACGVHAGEGSVASAPKRGRRDRRLVCMCCVSLTRWRGVWAGALSASLSGFFDYSGMLRVGSAATSPLCGGCLHGWGAVGAWAFGGLSGYPPWRVLVGGGRGLSSV
jgi:hypothetical protein